MPTDHPEYEKPGFYQHWINESVRFHDLDAYSHVNNNVIGIYFETARMRWLEDVQPKGWLTPAHFVLFKHTIFFVNQLNYPNAIRIGQRILKMGNSSLHMASAVFQGDTCVATCENISVWIGHDSGEAEPIPENLRQQIKKYL